MNVIECMEKRHSTRQFSTRKVEKEKLEQIVRCAVLAPTGRNTQALRFVVLQREEDMQTFLKYAKHVLKKEQSPYYGANAIIFVFADMEKAITLCRMRPQRLRTCCWRLRSSVWLPAGSTRHPFSISRRCREKNISGYGDWNSMNVWNPVRWAIRMRIFCRRKSRRTSFALSDDG